MWIFKIDDRDIPIYGPLYQLIFFLFKMYDHKFMTY